MLRECHLTQGYMISKTTIGQLKGQANAMVDIIAMLHEQHFELLTISVQNALK
jgi:hypothetical protein